MKTRIQRVINSKWFEDLLPILTLAFTCLIFAAATGGKFVSPANLKMITNQAVVVALISTGAVYVYSSGNMNVAMGGTTIIAALFSINVYLKTGSFLPAFFGAILFSVVLMGVIVIVGKLLNVSMQVLTMLLMTFFSALQTTILANNTLSVPFTAARALQKANIPVIILAVFVVFSIFMFDFTPLGRTLKYIGENRICARLTGINEQKNMILAYVLSALGIGLGAFAYVIRNASVSTSSGSGLNMDVILAMVLAGSPLKGGSRSKIYAGVIGAYLSVGLGNGLLMLGVNSYYVQVIKGILFIVILCFTTKRPNDLPVKQMIG